MAADRSQSYDVIVIGAGPVGLTVANFLGAQSLTVLVIEQLDRLIDYPRGVGMDDECLRVFQSLGLAEKITPHTLPNQWLEFQTADGRPFAHIQPRTTVYGWPKRNAFIQPLTDKVLYDGLSRYPSIEMKFSHEVARVAQDVEGVTVDARDKDGRDVTFRGKYLVGCDGGRSITRKQINIDFVGQTESTRWLVVDIENDPVGIPNAVLRCDPARPYVTISLPHGVRRLEFMVKPHETDDVVSSPEWLRNILAHANVASDSAKLIRSRVYTHHARLATSFQSDRIFLAGDAAHLMPVWQGQGYNSGIRDANNLAWKLAAVLRGTCDPRLLETYTVERRGHAHAMISLSTLVGRIFSPTNPLIAAARDFVFGILNRIPAARDYVVQMRFKPMPRYTEGVVIHGPDRKGRITAVGQLFIQPKVGLRDGRVVRLDDAIGNRFSIVAWNSDPSLYFDANASQIWQALDGQVFIVRAQTELALSHGSGHVPENLLGDATMALKDWFATYNTGVVILRPDRFVAATCLPQEISMTIASLANVLHYRKTQH